MERTFSSDVAGCEGKKISVAGWVAARRDHGKLIFIDLRDKEGLVQVVFAPDKEKPGVMEAAEMLRPEWVISVTGSVKRRPANMVNKELPSGEFEVGAEEVIVINQSETPPFDLAGRGMEISEETRMKYRYLDLRRPRLLGNLRNRAAIVRLIRNELADQGFVEIETPCIGRATPEGARDYLVPARLHPGKFYALAQSPQQYKQLLMVAGLERYFQIARCFRDEDTRGDRQPEFTQLDLEMSFVEREDVMALNEALLIKIVRELYPEKEIQEIPFPRLTYLEAMAQHGTDRPDLRRDKNNPNLLAFGWVIDFPFFEKTDQGGWTFTHNPFSAPKPEHMADLLAMRNIPEILTSQYDAALNGFEIGGGSIRSHTAEALIAVFRIMGYKETEIRDDFGHMLDAFKYGAPPHGGIAWGLDRLVSILQNEPNIREVIAFPKTGDGRDLMMNAPSTVQENQLKELRLKPNLPIN